MSVPARIDKVGLGDKRSGSTTRGRGRTRAVGLELTWWRQETSVPAQVDMVWVGHERSGSREPGGDGT